MPTVACSSPDHRKPSGDLSLGSPSSERESGVMDHENKELPAKPTLTVAEGGQHRARAQSTRISPRSKRLRETTSCTTGRLVAVGGGASSELRLRSSLGL